jgi:peroxiredoxin
MPMRAVMMGLLLCVPSLPAQETKPQTPKERYEAIVNEFKAAGKAWSDQYERYNIEEGQASEADLESRFLAWPGWSFAPRFLEMAESHPEDPVAVNALLQIVCEIGIRVSPNDKQLFPSYRKALELLMRDHLDDERLATACQWIRRFVSPPAEEFLRTLSEKGRERNMRGMACICLAEYLVAKRELLLKPWFDDQKISPFKRFFVSRWDPSFFHYIRQSDPEALYKEAEGQFKRAIKEYGDIVYWQDHRQTDRSETIANAAKMKLNQLRLSIGNIAPETAGRDMDGRPMKLSDYRGKAIVLSFWATWCPPCMAMVPHERSLVERLEGKPLVLIGINGDEDLEHARKIVQSEKITWRSWSDGKPPGPIATQWDVRSWPNFYIIDAKGVIRYKFRSFGEKFAFDKEFEDVLDGLLKEMDRENKP